jgi:low affinity Fe/Cu permease
MDRIFTWFAGRISSLVGHPGAFAVALGVILIWGATGPIFAYSDTWQLIINTATTIVTFLMVFVIQNSQNRDAAAMQAKLDELLRAVPAARGAFIGIEHLTDVQIEQIRDALERETGNRKDEKGGTKGSADESVDRLLARF